MEVVNPDFELLRSTAVAVGTEAAELVQRMRGGQDRFLGAVDTKSTETDVVTAADKASEQLIRERLATLRPGEAILGEEGGADPGAGRLLWVVDPIDGTVNYLYGLPWYAVSVAVQLDGVSVAAAVVEPASGRVWSAVRGGGATLDGQPLRASATNRLDLSLVGTGYAYAAERRARQADVSAVLARHTRDLRRTGSAALDLCAVAAGWLDAYYEHGLGHWDWAGGSLIAEEAGALVRFPDGTEDGLGGDITLAAAPGIAAELADALRAAGAAKI
ncbi:inositol monophosphatase family protein [Allokutzneria sp. NRRL B-24872]|uniref:inositol monophosphatase family protein n=1 Tax=Allokutzneria sp. NRRL B-24872 TaxID=1137961 RepID=UPI000A3D35D6|nr:inositol monophosphatase family protein [Allokutzneria sp. NRRL B-24872]